MAMGRLLGMTLAVAAVLLALPAAAPAATTCDYSSGVLSVSQSAQGDFALLEVPPGGEIVPRSGASQIVCTGVGEPPSVTNTNAVSVTASEPSSHVFIRHASRFAPGANTVGENGGDPEIEIFVNFNDQPFSTLSVGTDTSGGSIRFGTDGINPNASPGEVQPDADIIPPDVARFEAIGGDGPDIIGAEGGAGTGNPLPVSVVFNGVAGSDTLTGGAGGDQLIGGEGGDILVGGAGNNQLTGLDGNDHFLPGPDNDTVIGGSGLDDASYELGATGAVAVDLAIAGPQNTGGSALDSFSDVEDLGGTGFADALRGDAGTNTLVGAGGNDFLDGRDGLDTLFGGPGADALHVRDGGPDQGFCGTETDTATADAFGTDVLTECENTLFPAVDPPATPPPGTAPPPGTQPGGTAPPVPPADTTAPAFLGASRARPSRFAVVRGGGTVFRYRLSEAARVVFTVERRVRGRRVGTSCGGGDALEPEKGGLRTVRAGRCLRPARDRWRQPQAVLGAHRQEEAGGGLLPRHARRDRRGRQQVDGDASRLRGRPAMTGGGPWSRVVAAVSLAAFVLVEDPRPRCRGRRCRSGRRARQRDP